MDPAFSPRSRWWNHRYLVNSINPDKHTRSHDLFFTRLCFMEKRFFRNSDTPTNRVFSRSPKGSTSSEWNRWSIMNDLESVILPSRVERCISGNPKTEYRPAIVVAASRATFTVTCVPRILAMIFRGGARTPTIYKWSEPGRVGERFESTELPPRAATAAVVSCGEQFATPW